MNESFDVIYSYTRSQALEDGVLIDITEFAKEAGFRFPTAVSANLYYNILTPTSSLVSQGQSFESRVWDLLNILHATIKSNPNTSRLTFSPPFIMTHGMKPSPIEIVSTIDPGDHLDPVITIFLPEDD